jgi:hypothetical protein
MIRTVNGIILLITTWIILSGCSVTHNVKTKPVKALVKDLKEISESVESVKVTFTRPQVSYYINISEEPSSEILEALVNKVKTFTSEANMDLIAKSVNWNDHIWDVSLNINTDDDAQTAEHNYSARYFKTSNDQSNENIDAYQTWYKSK